MPDSYTLRFGRDRLVLTKSDDLVAVRPEPGRDAIMADVVRSVTSGRMTGEMLGRFSLARLASTPKANDDALDVLRRETAIAVGSHVFHTGIDKVPFVPSGDLFVRFNDHVADSERTALLHANGLQILEVRGNSDIIACVTTRADNPVKVAANLQSEPSIDVAEPELVSRAKLTAFTTSHDEFLSEEWHLNNTGFHRGTSVGFRKGADANVLAAWTAMGNTGSSNIVIAVIDDGFDLSHPDLGPAARLVAPWDFQANTAHPVAGNGDWHGTACAAVAAATEGGGNVIGVAPGAGLMLVRRNPDLRDSAVERWFQHVQVNHASVVSCSWGAEAKNFPLSTRMSEAIGRCATRGRDGKGCVIVFAAGNDARDIDDPATDSLNGFANHPDIVAVAASNSMDLRSDYSNFGTAICVCAPSNGAGGWGILTADVTGEMSQAGVTSPRGYSDGDYYWEFGGTSGACALVAGVCALVLSVDPSLTASQVRSTLARSARKIGLPEDYIDGHSRFFGHGCVDAAAAVTLAMHS